MDSLRKRYLYKLASNGVGFFISMVTATIVPRGLGPQSYGEYNYLTNFFTQIVGFFDLGTSTALYNKVSQRPDESEIIHFYKRFMLLMAVILLTIASCSLIPRVRSLLWPNQRVIFILFAAVCALMAWVLQITNSLTDAFAITIKSEKAKILQRVIGVGLIVLLFYWNALTLTAYFIYQLLLALFLVAVFYSLIVKDKPLLHATSPLPANHMKEYAKEFYLYAYPLFTMSLLGMIIGIFDRWILQVYGGSVQQGFYGLAFNIGAFCFLFTGAMTPLIMREFAIAYSSKDNERMATVFRRYVPFLFALTAWFCCFIAVESRSVSFLFGGHAFKEASVVILIMAFYPLHQTYGQLTGSFFMATGQTRQYRNIGLIFMVIGLPLTYLMIAPSAHFGLDGGAVGLAAKMVLVQVLSVNTFLWFTLKYLKLPFLKYLAHQLVVVVVFVSVGLVVRVFFARLDLPEVPRFLLSGVVYSAFSAILVYSFPILFGIKKKDIQSVFAGLLLRIKFGN